MLALRRQHHQEIATALTDRDATQRRITGLYTRAAEQLGNDTAPVRLGGLYALEGPLRTIPRNARPSSTWSGLTAQRILADHLRIDWFPGQSAPGPAGSEF